MAMLLMSNMIVIKVSENNNGDKKRSREYTYKGTMMII